MQFNFAVLAEEGGDLSLFLGEDLITWLILAFGGALFVGNLAAVLRPPSPEKRRNRQGRRRESQPDGDETLERAPVGRSLFMAGIGLIAAIWALASLITG